MAKSKLRGSPYDIYHNLEHHIQVWERCKYIIKTENLKLDNSTLKIASFWHDVFKGRENEEELLNQSMKSVGLNNERILKIIKIISEHSFGKDQTIVESKILFDADKIENVSNARWEYAFDAQARKEISISQRDKYIKEWNRRIPLLIGKLHFETSNKLFCDNLTRIRNWLKSINKLNEKGEFISEIN
ncbi:MAG: HD domain-containing protein [Ignavibacteriae bacterium]|nr:HD domain-containing protein [Ignavibacteriota bacterium]